MLRQSHSTVQRKKVFVNLLIDSRSIARVQAREVIANLLVCIVVLILFLATCALQGFILREHFVKHIANECEIPVHHEQFAKVAKYKLKCLHLTN